MTEDPPPTALLPPLEKQLILFRNLPPLLHAPLYDAPSVMYTFRIHTDFLLFYYGFPLEYFCISFKKNGSEDNGA